MLLKNDRILLACLAAVLWSATARAELTFLPESKHQQFQTYALYFEEQSMLIYKSGSRAWGALGFGSAVLGEESCPWKPQLIVHASANAAYQLSTSGDALLTQTIDARVGLALDLSFTDSFRGMIMWTHQSGHISDNVEDSQLIGSNLGNEILTLRALKDFDREARVGASLTPMLGSDPGMTRFGAEQFAEWFPFKASEDPRHLSPFVAAGLTEYGRSALGLNFHAQAGWAAGNHFDEKHHVGMRFVAGYYNGVDPRLKYFQFTNGRAEFGYVGMMLDI